jgi:hypothetical protein
VQTRTALAQARYAYLFNRCDDGFLFLRPFFEAYRQLRVLDDRFLYMRGVPFFETFWGYLAGVAVGLIVGIAGVVAARADGRPEPPLRISPPGRESVAPASPADASH